jgi:putative hemolysin
MLGTNNTSTSRGFRIDIRRSCGSWESDRLEGLSGIPIWKGQAPLDNKNKSCTNRSTFGSVQIDSFRGVESAPAAYAVRLASTAQDVRAAQRLRFLVFNVELGEGCDRSYHTCRDEDVFDAVCDHLLVEWKGKVVGTYRMQPKWSEKCDSYCGREFDCSPFELMRSEIVELGRACIASEHRNGIVLRLLWRGVAAYARARKCRYLMGCTSLTSQDEAEGLALHALLVKKHLAPIPWRTKPKPAYACALRSRSKTPPRLPKLLSAYLALGARICAPPAIDRGFKTIDFLTYLDLYTVPIGTQQFLSKGAEFR